MTSKRCVVIQYAMYRPLGRHATVDMFAMKEDGRGDSNMTNDHAKRVLCAITGANTDCSTRTIQSGGRT
jgi:hypothetical protein